MNWDPAWERKRTPVLRLRSKPEMKENEMRNWTDAQDAIAYDTFKQLADHKGVVYAQTMMGRIQDMGADFENRDVDAWVARYTDEDDWRQEQADQERAADEFVFRNSTI